jgi:hypothetical protein
MYVMHVGDDGHAVRARVAPRGPAWPRVAPRGPACSGKLKVCPWHAKHFLADGNLISDTFFCKFPGHFPGPFSGPCGAHAGPTRCTRGAALRGRHPHWCSAGGRGEGCASWISNNGHVSCIPFCLLLLLYISAPGHQTVTMEYGS